MSRIWAVLVAACILCVPVKANDGGQTEREVAAARERIHALLREAEELQEVGRAERADALRREAAQLKERLAHQVEGMEWEAHQAHLHKALKSLEQGIAGLRQLGRHDAAGMLERIADEVRDELVAPRDRKRRHHRERQVMVNQIEVMRMVLPVLLEADRVEAAGTLERAIRARELVLEGRGDREARAIREGAPKQGQIIEILALAKALYRDFGMQEKADHLSRLTEELWQRERREKRRGFEDFPEQVRHDLEVMKIAMHALREAEKRDAADILKHAIQARVIDLKGLEGAEADLVRERAPSLGQQVEILAWASELWREFGHEEKAEAVAELAERISASRRGEQERDRLREVDPATRERVDALEATIDGLQQVIDGLREEIRELRRQR